MTFLKLSNGNKTKIDSDLYEYLSQFNWYESKDNYAFRVKNNKRIYLHRVVNKTPNKLFTDHINGNTLDNRKQNLRTVTHQQNMFNTKIQKNRTSKYKGVTWDKQMNQWRVRVGQIFIGLFKNELHAAIAYDINAKYLHKQFALLNL